MNKKWHYSVLQKYRDITFGDIISVNDLAEEISLKVGDELRMYWLFHRNKERYLIAANPATDFPIIIRETKKLPYRNKVYNIVSRFTTLDIKPAKIKTYRDIVDDLCAFIHSNPVHQKLSAIIATCAYIDRINVRVCGEKEFGKDSIYDCIGHLKGDVCVFNPESLPAIEYRLNNKILVLNEIGCVPKEQRPLILKALLLMGGMNNKYEKAKRGGTFESKDVYDISDMSMCLMFNPISYYKDPEMFFDVAFKSPALMSRFLPLYFTGSLDITQFSADFDVSAEAQKWQRDLINITKSLLYYKEHKQDELKDWDKYHETKMLYVSQVKGRHQMHLDRILNALNLYCDDMEEFVKYADELLRAHQAYAVINAEGLKIDEMEDVVI